VTIKVFAYPVTIKDQRTGEKLEDMIVLPKEWLQICGSEGVNICDDKHMIYRAYNAKGYEVLEIRKRHNVQLTVNLEDLYHSQTQMEQLQAFGRFQAGVYPGTPGGTVSE
jgi:hypothetical protein